MAIVLPFLESERITKQSPAAPEPGRPFALIDKVKGAMVLMAVDREAAHLGLAPGMKLADARALVPDLKGLDHDPVADAAALDRLAEACLRYTPMVAVTPPDALLLDISGCTHFFASETALAEDAEDRFDRAGHGISWALAGTADAALALARHGLSEGGEAQLPVSALAMNERTHRALERAGLYHIGDLASRPRAALAARFGATLVQRLERLLGQADQPIDPLRRQHNIVTERRFAEPMTHADAATSCLEELFAEAAMELEQRGQGARLIGMTLFRCDGEISRLQIETAPATRDPALFRRLLKERIAALDDPLNPGFGYDLIRLHIVATDMLAAEQYRLEGGEDHRAGQRHADRAALVSQLSTRLGRERVQRFAVADSHIPEQALLALPALDHPPPQQWAAPQPGEPPLRPLHLFDPPQRVTVLAQVPDGPPYRFTWRRKTHLVRRYEGPERIASEWWRRRHGQQPGKGGLTRDYYRVEDVHGHRFWLFRHGLYGSEKERPDWYIHGLFA